LYLVIEKVDERLVLDLLNVEHPDSMKNSSVSKCMRDNIVLFFW